MKIELKVPAETKQILTILAEASNMSLEEYVQWVLDEAVKNRDFFKR